MHNGLVPCNRLPGGFYACVVETDAHEPDINCGDIVFIDSRHKGYRSPGFYVFGTGRLTRCYVGVNHGMIRICEGRDDDAPFECDADLFKATSEGRVMYVMHWLIDATPEIVGDFIDQVGVPVIKPSVLPTELVGAA